MADKISLVPSSTHHSWIRYVGPFLLFWAAGSIPSCTEGVSAPQYIEPSRHSRIASSHQYEAQKPWSQRRRRRRRWAQEVPTVEQLLENAIASEEAICTLNENGLYGSPVGGNIVAIANYLYQISVVPGTTTSQLEDVVLSEIDRALPTAVLPVFFPECNSNNNNNAGRALRQLQSSDQRRVLAISMMPTDYLVLDGQITCTKSVPNTNCYVGQGGTTIIGTGFSSEAQLVTVLQSALQAAVQGNAIIQSLNTNLVVDVTMLDPTTRQTLPPITPAPLASPVVAPAPTNKPPTGAPIAPTAPTSPTFDFPSFVGGNTVAPLPAPTAPTSPTFDFPSLGGNTEAPLSAPAQRPIDVPAPISRPGDPSPTVTVPTGPLPLTFAPFTPNSPGEPTQALAPSVLPSAGEPSVPAPPTTQPSVGQDSDSDRQSVEGDGDQVEWWVWLLTAAGGCMVIVCCLSVARKGRGESVGDGGFPHPNSSTNKRMAGNSNEDDPETPLYEPPPSLAFVPPGMGAFSVAHPPDSAAATSPFVNEEDADEDESEASASGSEENPGGDDDEIESYTEGDEGGTYQDGLDDDDEEEVVEEEVFADESEYQDDEDGGEETFGEEETEEEESNTGTWGQQSYEYQ